MNPGDEEEDENTDPTMSNTGVWRILNGQPRPSTRDSKPLISEAHRRHNSTAHSSWRYR